MADQAPINEKTPYPTATAGPTYSEPGPPYPATSGPPMPQPEGTIPPPYPAQGMPPPVGGYQNTQPPPGYFAGQQVTPVGAVPVQPVGYPVGPTTAIIVGARWSEVPQLANCTTCNKQVMTSVAYVPGSMAWLLCFIIVIFGGWLFCLCLIPFCMDACKDVVHSCPSCNRNLGIYKRG